jgi:hypothetical protein
MARQPEHKKKNPQEVVIDATLDNFKNIRENTQKVLDQSLSLRNRQKYLISLLTEGRYFRNMKNHVLDTFMTIPQMVEDLRDLERQKIKHQSLERHMADKMLELQLLKDDLAVLHLNGTGNGRKKFVNAVKKVKQKENEIEDEKLNFLNEWYKKTESEIPVRSQLIDELCNIWEQEAQQIIKECYPNLEEYTLKTLKAVADMKIVMMPGKQNWKSDSISMDSDVDFANM